MDQYELFLLQAPVMQSCHFFRVKHLGWCSAYIFDTLRSATCIGLGGYGSRRKRLRTWFSLRGRPINRRSGRLAG